MGIFAIPELNPLPGPRAAEPVLEPPPPVARPENSPAQDRSADLDYTPSDSTQPDANSREEASDPDAADPTPTEPSAADESEAHLNLFA